MKSIISVMLLILLAGAVAGCVESPDKDGTPNSTLPAYSASTYDSRYGVVCYRNAVSSNNLSCVKVN